MKKVICLVVVMIGASTLAMGQFLDIAIDQKNGLSQNPLCIRNGWDTVVTPNNNVLELSATSFATAQHFNGNYLVQQIPYKPADSTFHAGVYLNSSYYEDGWEPNIALLPFSFQFFGKSYTQAVVGSNGLVSFNTGQNGTVNVAGSHCSYSYNVPIPRPDFETANSTDNSKNAIYGIYEDIYPSFFRSNDGACGLFRYVGGTYPRRYFCASVNGVAPFGNNIQYYNTYQIVCYEGTNIIEVHVKERNGCSTTNGGKGLIGIMNETGLDQISTMDSLCYDDSGVPVFTNWIYPNSPGAFVAPNRGNQSIDGWTGNTSIEAWRFIPQGDTVEETIQWWRLLESGDSVEVGFTSNDANALASEGYYTSEDHKSCTVNPSSTARYLVSMKVTGADGHNYYLSDTITVGMDYSTTGINRSQMDSYRVFAEYGGITVQNAPNRMIRIYDSMGKLIVAERSNDTSYHFPMEVSGTYIVQVDTQKAQKVVVVK